MALRIFEPRYIRMVKQVCRDDTGFVVCMINQSGEGENNTNIFPLGTFCKVIDFDVLDDGLLGLTIEGKHCVAITEIETEFDGLRIGECSKTNIWQCDVPASELAPMDKRLKEVFDKYPEVSQLYETCKYDNAVWVINRWLELLPLGAEQKQHFLAQPECTKVLEYLSQLIE